MRIKRKIIRILTMLMWVVLSAGVTVLLVAAVDIKNHKTCRQVKIGISGVKDFSFLNTEDITRIISANGMNHPVGKPIAACDLQSIEAALEKNIWIKGARLFFDNKLVLHVQVWEREPIARIFDTKGFSFYIDSSGFVIPLGAKRLPVQLPVFTGFPHGAYGAPASTDSLLISQIRNISGYIRQDSFWKAQIAQVDITPQKTFEITPTLGNHLIEFGDGDDYANKFNRLVLFYKQVSALYGLDRYTRISVQYRDQVIGTKKSAVSRIDSLQAIKNIEKMIDQAQQISTDTASVHEEPAVHASAGNVGINGDPGKPVPAAGARPTAGGVDKITVPARQPAARVARQAKVKEHQIMPKPVAPVSKPKAVMRKIH